MEKDINKEIENQLKKNNFCKLSDIKMFSSNQNKNNLIFQEAVKFTSQGFLLLGYVVYEQNQKIVCNYAYSNKIEELLTISLNQNQKIMIKQIQFLALHSEDILMNEAINMLNSTSQSLIVKKPTTIQVLPPYAIDPQYFEKQKQAKKQKQPNKDKKTKPQQKQVQNTKAQDKKEERQIKKEEELPRIKSQNQKYVEPVQHNKKPFTQISKPKEIQIKIQERKRKIQIQSDQDQYNPQEFMKAFKNKLFQQNIQKMEELKKPNKPNKKQNIDKKYPNKSQKREKMDIQQNSIKLHKDFKCTNDNQMQVKFIFSEDKKDMLTLTYDAVLSIFNQYQKPQNNFVAGLRMEPAYNQNNRQISSYFDQNSTKTKKELLNQIKVFFNQHDYQFNLLYFVGHGAQLDFQGNQQTYFCWYRYQKLEYISFSQIVNLWLPRKTKYLMIILNSCTSGDWVYQLQNSPKRGSISLISSCQQDNKSYTIKISRNEINQTFNINRLPGLKFLTQTSRQVSYLVSYFTLIFFKCFLAKIHQGSLTQKNIKQILQNFEKQRQQADTNYQKQNIQICCKFGFYEFLTSLNNEKQYYLNDKYQRLTNALLYKSSTNQVTSVFTGDQREDQQIQNKFGIFHKRSLKEGQTSLFYQGGFEKYQFHGLGRAHLFNEKKDQNRFAEYHYKRISNCREYFGKSYIDGQTFLMRNLSNLGPQKNLFQNYFLNIQTNAHIPDDSFFNNSNIQVLYTKNQSQDHQKHYLNIGFRMNKFQKFLTLQTRISGKYPFQRKVSAQNFVEKGNAQNYQFYQQPKKIIDKYQKYPQKYSIKITNNQNGILSLYFEFNYEFKKYNFKKQQIKQKQPIQFQMPAKFHYRNLFDEILIKGVTYVFKEFYDESNNKSVGSVYYLQNQSNYNKICHQIMLNKLFDYIKLQTNLIGQIFRNQQFKNQCCSQISKKIYSLLKNQNQTNYKNKIRVYLDQCQNFQLSQNIIEGWIDQASKNNDLAALKDFILELYQLLNNGRMKIWLQQIKNFNIRNLTTFK